MSGNNFNKGYNTPRVLVAPLDWGLGHATRCIPIINELIKCGCEVLIAADKYVFFLLKKEFPGLVFLRCKGYEIEYSRRKEHLPLKIILQTPFIFFSIWREKKWLQKMIKVHQIDAVISDNRFGMYTRKISSIYITHQLSIKTGNKRADSLAKKFHYYFIKKYTNCWVPDFEKNGLAGDLSHPVVIPPNVKYIGPLSRFISLEPIEKKYDLLITISGPEPQRTIFENEILEELKEFVGNVLFVRGLPGETGNITIENKSVTITNHLGADELNKVMEQSKIIIGRSGYTSVMDLVALGKHAILIPTPGQTEQEYLAGYLSDKGFFYTASEESFSLKELIKKSQEFEFKKIQSYREDYKKTINEFVLSLKTPKFATQ